MAKGYATGMRHERIRVMNRTAATTPGKWGVDGSGIGWQESGEFWAWVDWQKGKSAMREGALDAYGVILVRMLWTDAINMRSRVIHDGIVYQIIADTFHANKFENIVQFMAQVPVDDMESTSDLTPVAVSPANY